MRLVSSPKKMQQIALSLKKKGKKIAFVPTMGFLHEGHVTLLKKARKHGDVVILSIFVNPTQFGPNEDLSRYPRDTKGDLKKAREAGVDFVFFPTPDNMYLENHETFVEVPRASGALCGLSRPGHFRGVATVVLKLFNIVQPDVALFGLKDFQQCAVIKKMVKDLNVPVKVVGVPTVREKDGLAMSSRNVYLSSEERRAALCLSQGLKKVRLAVRAGEREIPALLSVLEAEIRREPLARIDYVQCMDAENMTPSDAYRKNKTLFVLAVFIGKTRLIDNAVV